MRIQFHKSNNVALPQRLRQRGSGYFEFAIVAVVFAILCGMLLRKLQFYQQESERIAVEQVVTSLRAALANRVTSLYLKGNQAELAVLGKQNPMEWLERRPPNYAGEFAAPEPGAIPNGQWYFDRSTATLSYLLNKRSFFGETNARRLNFKVKFRQNPSIITNSHEGAGPGGVTLEKIDD